MTYPDCETGVAREASVYNTGLALQWGWGGSLADLEVMLAVGGFFVAGPAGAILLHCHGYQ